VLSEVNHVKAPFAVGGVILLVVAALTLLLPTKPREV